MDNNKIKVIYPNYFNDFRCSADKCRNHCCHSWKIDVNKNNYFKLKSAMTGEEKPKFNNSFKTIKNGTDFSYATIKLNKKEVCPFFNKEHLCDLQISHGYDMLPHICKTFPRENIKSGKTLFQYLVPACEEVVKQLLNLPDGITFVNDEQSPDNVTNHLKNTNLFGDNFWDVYNTIVAILQNRNFKIEQRLFILGESMSLLDEKIFDKDFDIADWCKKYTDSDYVNSSNNIDKFKILEKTGDNKILSIKNNISIMVKLKEAVEVSIDMKLLINEVAKNLNCGNNILNVVVDEEIFNKRLANFNTFFKDKEYFWENLLVSILPVFLKNNQHFNIWDTYLVLLMAYNLYKLILISYSENLTDEKIEDLIARASRNILNGSVMGIIISILKQIRYYTFAPIVNSFMY